MKNLWLVLLVSVVASLAAGSTHALAQTGNVGIGIANPQSKLHVSGSVRLDTLAGVGRRMVYADAQGRLTTLTPLNTNVVTAQIPDEGCLSGNGLISSIVVSGQPTSVPSASIKVRVDITHPLCFQVAAYLISPTGTTLRLITSSGGTGSNFTNTILWDGAAQSLPIPGYNAPFTGTYKPTGSASVSCGITAVVSTFGALGSGGVINPNGQWQLQIFDREAGDVGQLNNWGTTFDGSDPQVPPTGLTANAVPKSNGNVLVNGSIYDVNGSVGIGTFSPGIALDVAGSTIGLRNTNVWDHFYLSHDGNTANLMAGGADNGLVLGVSGANAGGYGAQGYTEGMRILPNGHVGVGVGVMPLYRLQATSSEATTAYFNSTASDPDGVVKINIPSTNLACPTCSEFVEFQKAGATIGSITANLSTNTISYGTSSDRRLKENIAATCYGLDDLMKIQIKDYNFKGTDAGARVTGVMAQDLFGIYPDAVKQGDNGEQVQNPWAVDYGKLTPLLIKAVQDQQAQIEAQQARLANLEAKEATYSELAGQLEEIQQMLGVKQKMAGRKVGKQ